MFVKIQKNANLVAATKWKKWPQIEKYDTFTGSHDQPKKKGAGNTYRWLMRPQSE
jgi:hypothetical protein